MNQEITIRLTETAWVILQCGLIRRAAVLLRNILPDERRPYQSYLFMAPGIGIN